MLILNIVNAVPVSPKKKQTKSSHVGADWSGTVNKMLGVPRGSQSTQPGDHTSILGTDSWDQTCLAVLTVTVKLVPWPLSQQLMFSSSVKLFCRPYTFLMHRNSLLEIESSVCLLEHCPTVVKVFNWRCTHS